MDSVAIKHPLVWVDNGQSNSRAMIRDGAYYRVHCTYWWVHPSWMKPQSVGYWDGDLAPAKAAAQAHYEEHDGNPPEVDFS